MVAYFCQEIQDNYHDYFEETIARNKSFKESLARQNVKINFEETLIYHNSFPK